MKKLVSLLVCAAIILFTGCGTEQPGIDASSSPLPSSSQALPPSADMPSPSSSDISSDIAGDQSLEYLVDEFLSVDPDFAGQYKPWQAYERDENGMAINVKKQDTPVYRPVSRVNSTVFLDKDFKPAYTIPYSLDNYQMYIEYDQNNNMSYFKTTKHNTLKAGKSVEDATVKIEDVRYSLDGKLMEQKYAIINENGREKLIDNKTNKVLLSGGNRYEIYDRFIFSYKYDEDGSDVTAYDYDLNKKVSFTSLGYDEYPSFFDGKIKLPFKENGKCGFIDITGNKIFTQTFEWAYPMKDGMAVINSFDRQTLINDKGKVLMTADYIGELEDFGFRIRNQGQSEVYDKNLKKIIDCKTYGSSFQDGVLTVSGEHFTRIYNTKTKQVATLPFQDVSWLGEDRFLISNNNQGEYFVQKIIGFDGRVILEAKQTWLSLYGNFICSEGIIYNLMGQVILSGYDASYIQLDPAHLYVHNDFWRGYIDITGKWLYKESMFDMYEDYD